MITEAITQKTAWISGVSVFLVTVSVTPNSTLDPINVSKLWILSAIGFAAIFLILGERSLFWAKENRVYTIGILSLPFFMLLGMFFTDSTISRELFGTYGRNTGLIAYLSFASIALLISLTAKVNIKRTFLIGTTGALAVNVSYGLIQALGYDPNKWTIIYSPVFGTLGNPDFLSAFLGFGAAFSLAYLFARNENIKTRILSILYLPLAIFVIFKSGSQQGVIVFGLVFSVVVFFELRNRLKSNTLLISYTVLIVFSGVIVFLGALQRGPLASLIYRTSVSARGYYWEAGLKMVLENPLFGVGLDSYGDWYRSSRSIVATQSNSSVVSNSAHNVFIDIASTAGLLALFAYLFFIFLALKSAWRIYRTEIKLDPFFIATFAAWIGFLAQSMISINNLALGIWGWILPGLIIAMGRWNSADETYKENSKGKTKGKLDFSGIWLSFGILTGAVIGFIPFNADANFRHSLEAVNPEKIFTAAQEWPTDTSRLLYGAIQFQSNKLDEQALDLARFAVDQNPRSFEAWDFISKSPLATETDKKKAINEMIKLDPFNKTIKP